MWTWKGRMFYLIFLWLLLIESIIDWNNIIENRLKNTFKILASFICALVPTFYILAINFLGLDQIILNLGQYFEIRSGDFIYFHWPLSWEYLVFAISFIGAITIAYKKQGLKTFSISLAFLGGVSVAYMFDTIYPFGVFRPLQEFALPTAATTAALFDLLGYTVRLSFPVYTVESLLPSLTVSMGGKSASVAIAWACAGVHSLLLYVLIIAVFFKKSSISAFRKLSYFVIGLFGTFFVNVLRVFSIVIIMLNYGSAAGIAFHDTYGEIYFFTWIFLFILLIVCIQRFTLIERTRYAFHVLPEKTRYTLHKLVSYSTSKIRKLSSYLRTKLKQH
jgi:thaumarchaeosortase